MRGYKQLASHHEKAATAFPSPRTADMLQPGQPGPGSPPHPPLAPGRVFYLGTQSQFIAFVFQAQSKLHGFDGLIEDAEHQPHAVPHQERQRDINFLGIGQGAKSLGFHQLPEAVHGKQYIPQVAHHRAEHDPGKLFGDVALGQRQFFGQAEKNKEQIEFRSQHAKAHRQDHGPKSRRRRRHHQVIRRPSKNNREQRDGQQAWQRILSERRFQRVLERIQRRRISNFGQFKYIRIQLRRLRSIPILFVIVVVLDLVDPFYHRRIDLQIVVNSILEQTVRPFDSPGDLIFPCAFLQLSHKASY